MRTQLKILRSNLTLTAVSVSICVLAGFLLSFPITAELHGEAAAFKSRGQTSITTAKLEAYDKTQFTIVLFAGTVGALAAQVAFALSYKKDKTDAA